MQDANLDKAQIESLLKKAIELDSKLAEAHLQLGNFYSDQGQYAAAIPEYVGAVQLNPNLADAHYRLGQAYVRTGQKERAQEQLQVYQRLRAEHLAEMDKQKSEIRQFVYSERSGEKQ
jgi:tetratricopeptide (TPR) repeat protein